MPISTLSSLHHEWLALQEQYDSYEKFSLLIKLVSVVLSCWLLFNLQLPIWTMLILAVLWMQDSIWKTFQNRISQRLLIIEHGLSEDQSAPCMQFNSQWLASRLGGVGILLEYLKQALKPTVAFPHLVMIGICALYYAIQA